MIAIRYMHIRDFEYDIQGLVRAFFPGADMVMDKEDCDLTIVTDITDKNIKISLCKGISVISEKSDCIDRASRKDTKNRLKRVLYDVLSEYTGRKLPWGTLSGIRPTKITTDLLRSGMTPGSVKDYIKKEYYISDEKSDLSIDISNREIQMLREIEYESGYSMYIGIPFCPSTCSYCSFTSYSLDVCRDRVGPYIDALCSEIRFVADMMKNHKLNTVYIGGGTPTTLLPVQLDRLLGEISCVTDTKSLSEFTVEAGRPDSITRKKLDVLKKYNVSRISINPQTMNEKTLKLIGRKHTAGQVRDSFALARYAGFDNINMDFIVGLPQETIDDVKYSMEEAAKLKPDSMTVHSLAIKRAAGMNINREMYKDYSYVNNESVMELTKKYALDMNMNPYYLYRQKNMKGNMENVGYAAGGKEGMYNVLMMEEVQSIAACGAGSISKRVDVGGAIKRGENVKNLDIYIKNIDEMLERKRKLFADFAKEHAEPA